LAVIRALALGAGVGLGVCLFAAGLTGVELPRAPARRWSSTRVALALAVSMGLFAVTRFPVALPAGATLGAALPGVLSARRRRRESLARVQALATLAEIIRDTTAAGLGLSESLRAAARVAPGPLAAELAVLEARLAREPLPGALRAFAADVADPLCDLVVASLLLAERRSGSLEGVLSGLATNAREEAALRARIEAGRAGLEASAAVVSATTLLLVGFLVTFRTDYLEPYRELVGQGVLCLVAGCFAASFAWLARLRRADTPPRLLAPEATS
jgi:tight adherence protein B